MKNEFVRLIGKMEWSEVTTLQKMCVLRKQQLRVLEKNVYVVRRAKTYLAYRRGTEEIWTDLNDRDLAVYPAFSIAEYVRSQNEGSTVVKIPKTEFVLLPACAKLIKEKMVTAEGHFAI